MNQIIETTIIVDTESYQIKPSQLLATHTGLSQAKIKEAMQKGAVWLYRSNKKARLRRASKSLKYGDKLEINYNAELLDQRVPVPILVHDEGDYSIWFKPYGLNCQGSRWGDFSSIHRWVESHIAELTSGAERPVFLVHRLDRATSGLMILCHSKTAARLFSALFKEGKIDKRYQAVVEGNCSDMPKDFLVDAEIDGKSATSIFNCSKTKDNHSLVEVNLLSGRKHQIRQHLKFIGHPIIGDRLYGNANSGDCNLQLQSVSIAFTCPMRNKPQYFEVSDQLRLILK